MNKKVKVGLFMQRFVSGASFFVLFCIMFIDMQATEQKSNIGMVPEIIQETKDQKYKGRLNLWENNKLTEVTSNMRVGQKCPQKSMRMENVARTKLGAADDPPFLIMHGSEDMTVIPEQSELLHEALNENGVESTLQILNGLDHGGRKWDKEITMVRSFFNEHLKIRAELKSLTAAARVQPHSSNPYYWEYKGEPVLLLGGSWQDNLFNHPTRLNEHLDILEQVGGNYVRNTMSSRNAGNVWAFAEVENGRYDLDRWNEEYWERFQAFLKATYKRGIIVQIEIWDAWDYFEDHQTQGGWSFNPFNPSNNVNYSAEESHLPNKVDDRPTAKSTDHAFFQTVPKLDDNQLVRAYQEAYVDRLLDVALEYPHVLYCVNNESNESLEWGDYWLRYVRERAKQAEKEIYLTDMRMNTDIRAQEHNFLYDQPALYTFLDISQNNVQEGQRHYDRLMHVRQRIVDHPRPMNNVKIYTFKGGPEESVQRFWRNIFAGSASSRFHRPHPLEHPYEHLSSEGSGIGLSPRAQVNIRSLRILTDRMNIFASEPHNDLLSDREDNEAYCLAEPGRKYAVYFPEGSSVTLNLSEISGEFSLHWLNIHQGTWQRPATVKGQQHLMLKAPDDRSWAALLTKRREP